MLSQVYRKTPSVPLLNDMSSNPSFSLEIVPWAILAMDVVAIVAGGSLILFGCQRCFTLAHHKFEAFIPNFKLRGSALGQAVKETTLYFLFLMALYNFLPQLLLLPPLKTKFG
jgi:hypothetical protein